MLCRNAYKLYYAWNSIKALNYTDNDFSCRPKCNGILLSEPLNEMTYFILNRDYAIVTLSHIYKFHGIPSILTRVKVRIIRRSTVHTRRQTSRSLKTFLIMLQNHKTQNFRKEIKKRKVENRNVTCISNR